MTKLFSMKSLAFAGAAAFALTLAAAPQADAAEAGKAGMAFQQVEKDGKLVDELSAENTVVLVSKSAVNVTDNKLEYYYSSVKSGEPKKWKTVSTSSYGTDTNGNYTIYVPVKEITKGKAASVYIAADATGSIKVGPIECKAAPKLKAVIKNLTSGPSIELTANKSEVKDGWISGESQYGGFDLGAEVEELADGKNEYLMEELQNIADFGGGTVTLHYMSDDDLTPSATTKLKVSGVANAPKLGLKIAKAFSVKIKNTVGYRTFVEGADTKDLKFTQGSGSAMTMKDLFGEANISKSGGDVEALENNMKVQVKTLAKGKKLDSRIGTTTVYASTVTPQAINAVIKNSVNAKKVTDASIEFKTDKLTLTQAKAVSNDAIVVLEYKAKDAKKWTEVKSGKSTVSFKNAKLPDEIYVRVKGTDASTKTGKTAAYEAPGHVMTIKIDKNDPEGGSTYATTSSALFVKAANAVY